MQEHPKTLPLTRKVAGRTFSAEVPVTWEPGADDYVIEGEDAKRFERAVAQALAVEGPIDGETFSFMRRAFGIPQTRLASLLDVAQETVSRWETGALPMSRAAWLALRAVVMEQAAESSPALERLERLASGETPASDVRITL